MASDLATLTLSGRTDSSREDVPVLPTDPVSAQRIPANWQITAQMLAQN
jgi:hypothetical protein